MYTQETVASCVFHDIAGMNFIKRLKVFFVVSGECGVLRSTNFGNLDQTNENVQEDNVFCKTNMYGKLKVSPCVDTFQKQGWITLALRQFLFGEICVIRSKMSSDIET